MANLHTGVRRAVVTAATSLLAVSGCGMTVGDGASGPADQPSASPIVPALPSSTPRSTSTTRRGPQPVEVTYLLQIKEDESTGQLRYNVVTDGGTKMRVKVSMYAEPGVVGEEYLYTWDGSRMLVYSMQNAPPYTVYEAPGEHLNEFLTVTAWQKNLWSTAPGPGCTDLKTTKTIIGRVAVGYRCVTASPEPGAPVVGELWIDQATGILLKAAPDMVAEKLVLNPKTNATTFSTRPPTGAKFTVIAAKNPPAGRTKKAPEFTLDLVRGGQIGLTDLAGKPFILAFFMADLAFDERGEVCPGCRDALLALQTLTSNGVKPRVLGVQIGDLGKPGYPLVVPGVTLTLAHEQTPVVQNSFGLTEMVGFVFVRADGTIAASYDGAPTKQQITQSLGALH